MFKEEDDTTMPPCTTVNYLDHEKGKANPPHPVLLLMMIS
jgi:hypothetical protein